ncbi:MAG: serine/threonine-protein kinase [Rudaea sp.]|uniref:tetratricopeptide repeat protein n=1 Tax=Rudaea sp. TaxID=2136325 RepID=UPI0039E4732D
MSDLRRLFDLVCDLPATQRIDALRAGGADDAMVREVLGLIEADSLTRTRARTGIGAMIADFGATELHAGDVLGAWRLVREIGHGGMGAVYLAERADGHFDQQAAVKLIRGLGDDGMAQRFARERQLLANLQHPQIARLLDGGATPGGAPYLVMEYVEGVSLGTWCEENNPNLDERLGIFVSICKTLQFAHQRLVVHCDLKPSNVLVREDGVPVLLDFGIAQALDRSGESAGDGCHFHTPRYASPEQARGEAPTIQSDVFALGALLYEMVSGRAPPPRDPARTTLPAPSTVAAAELPWRKRLGGDIDAILARACAADPAQRYTSALALAEDVERHLRGFPIRARETSRAYRWRKFAERNKLGVALACGALAVLIGFTVALAVQVRQVRQERDAAQRLADFLARVFSASDPAQARGKEISARALLDQGAANIDKQAIDDPKVRDRLLVTLANAYRSLSLNDRATPMYEQSLQIRERAYGADSRETLDALDNLAGAYLRDEQYDKMEAILPRWRELAAKLTGAESRESSAALSMAAANDVRKGNLVAAETAQLQVIEIAKKLFGAISREAFAGYGFLGYIQFYRGKDAAAERAFRTILGMLQQGDWQNSTQVVRVLDTQGKLGYTLTSQGRYAEAEPLLRDSLALCRKILGPKHTLVAYALVDMGFLNVSLGRYDEAGREFKEALDIQIELQGSDSLFVGGTRDELARLYLYKGRYEEAERLARAALPNFTLRADMHRPGEHGESAYMARVLNHLGLAQLGLNQLDAASATLEQALANEIRFNSETSFYVADDHLAIGRVQQAQGKLSEAERSMRKALAIYREHNEVNLAGRAEVLEKLGALLQMQQRDEAKSVLGESASIRARILPPDAPQRRRVEALIAAL